MTEVIDVPIENCTTDGFQNSRTELGDLTDLVESVKERGILEPLRGKMRDDGETVDIYIGFRRLAAAIDAGLKKVPVICVSRRAITKQQMLIDNIGENVQREDLNPVDEALAYKRLQSEHKMSVDEICGKVGIKKARLQQRFRLLKLTDVVRDAVQAGRIGVTAALEIDRLPKEKQGKFVEIAEELSGDRLKTLVSKELEKLQRKLEGTEGKGKNDKEKDAGQVTELVRTIRKAGTIVCNGLGYSDDQAARVKDVNFRVLEGDDLQTVAKLFDDVADTVPDDAPDFNDKAEAEIKTIVENTPEDRVFDVEDPGVRQAILAMVRQRAIELAIEAAEGTGRRPKVTFAIAKDAIDEFYADAEVAEE